MGPKSLFMIHTLAMQMTRDGSDQWVRFFSTVSHFYWEGSKIDNLLLRKRLGHNFHFYCLLFRWCKNIGLSKKLLQKRNFCVWQKKHKRPNEKEYLFYPGLVGFSGIMEVGRRWWWCWFYCWCERPVIILLLMRDALPSICPTQLKFGPMLTSNLFPGLKWAAWADKAFQHLKSARW